VSPTDPLAATAIARRLGVPRRLVTLLEGESLINDASALVAYRLAVGAVVAGSFSPCGRRVRHLPGAVRSLRAASDRSSRSRHSRSEDGWSRSGTPGTLLRSLSDQVQLSAL
jgi:Sodium/hydrogen exchanger family